MPHEGKGIDFFFLSMICSLFARQEYDEGVKIEHAYDKPVSPERQEVR